MQDNADTIRPPELQRRTGSRSRRDVLDAAARILRTHGYHATTLRDVAAAVGIKAGSIYYHFASKDEIVAAVMNDGVDRVRDAVCDALAALPPQASLPTRLQAAISAHLHALLEHSDYTSAGLKAYSDVPPAVQAAAREHRRTYEAIWDALTQEVMESGLVPSTVSPATLRMAVLGIMNWSPEWYRSEKHSIDVLAREFRVLIVRQ